MLVVDVVEGEELVEGRLAACACRTRGEGKGGRVKKNGRVGRLPGRKEGRGGGCPSVHAGLDSAIVCREGWGLGGPSASGDPPLRRGGGGARAPVPTFHTIGDL